MFVQNIVAPDRIDESKFTTKERKCPICKKNFIPAPYHAWKIGNYIDDEFGDEVNTGGHGKLVCTYSCMRKWEKAHGRKR